MRPEQQLSQEQLMKQECSFSEVCVPELMSLAAQNKDSIAILIQNLPQHWHFSDKVLVAVFPTFHEDVEAFYAGKGKSMTEMFAPHQLSSIDRGAQLTLLQKLADQYQNPIDP
jgi:hypothetical protein